MTHLHLEDGKLFRNGLGQPILISGVIPADTKDYHRGLRFVDHRGTRYTETGSVQSSFYAKLDLIEAIEKDDVTIPDIDKLATDLKTKLKKMGRLATIYRWNRKLITYASINNILVGLIRLRGNPALALTSIIVGTAGIYYNEKTPEELYTFA